MTTQDNLPVPVDETRKYIRVTPTDEPLDPQTVEAQFERLHQLESQEIETRRWTLLQEPPPALEIYLVAPKEDTQTIQYYFGIDTPDLHEPLERILRTIFPDTYEFRTVQWSPTLVPDQPPTAVRFDGQPDTRKDWQTRLTPLETFHQESDHVRTPLASVVEAFAATDGPALFQILVRPKSDWTVERDMHKQALEEGKETWVGQVIGALLGPSELDHSDVRIPVADRARLDELDERNPRRSFEVNIRAVLCDERDRHVADDLATAFTEVSHSCYELSGTVCRNTDAQRLRNKIVNRDFDPADYESLDSYLPLTSPTSPGIVVDASELGSFCLLDGSALPAEARRRLATTPGERKALPLPPPEQLQTYRGPGFPIGNPISQDGTVDHDPISLPPSLQPLHIGLIGKTGSGKTTSATNAICRNHAATEGATIINEPKGDGMVRAYLRAHYAMYGTLENVLYFDCSKVVPAFSFFDIRDDLDAGVARTTAVEETADHYLEILAGIMGPDRFEQAVRSPDIIRYLVKALFDSVNGDDAFSHRDLHTAVRQMHERQSAPAVSDDDLERMLAGVVANSARSFDEIMQGVANRIEKIPMDRRLARVFNHVPEEGDPHFDLDDYLDEDVVIIFDTSGLRREAREAMTRVILSNLWTALRRRAKRSPDADSYNLVNVYLEEAATVATSDILQELLAQSRSFGCSITLAMQFPEQLRAADENAYRELLNNVSTYVIGNVPIDRRLAERLATADLSADEIGAVLRAIRRGEWLARLPAAFGEPEPRPFRVESLPLPPGHPEGSGETVTNETVDELERSVAERTREHSGLTLGTPSTPDEEDAEASTPTLDRLDSVLPMTNRLPPTVRYVGEVHALCCTGCDNRYDTGIEGMKRAISCCSSIDAVDRDDVPICSIQLKLTPDEREASEWSDTQLLFLQAVYNAQQLRFDPLEYDLLSDSMLRLQEYVDIDSEAIQDLLDAGVLSHDTDHPHRLYTVTPAGRSEIGEHYRRGVEYGHGKGDLEESSEHVLAVEVGRRYLEAEYLDDEESPVVDVVPYYEPSANDTTTVPAAAAMGSDPDDIADAVTESEQRRLDVAGLDADGSIVVAVEAERINNDVHRAAPADFDKMAACGVEEAIWIVMSQSDGHDLLNVLRAPADGEPRIEKSYAETTPPQQFRLDTPGCTAIYPVSWLQGQLPE
ncbi:type IV secretory system conjugative DNA transfer family protein [Haloarcula salina]|uniref:Type IV secretion system DNA-binding domain-containing protein n=1 Tax=Haloarcula salina TaxID=1429914 RepID=A0AA41KBL8_9EURY|nr:type IV secretion system DNA-binding domain-containing protein [Haloarcula salina]MBV0901360.1 type IV secretion system DNA-binding domain-containing protein [Haloarcula salina]